MNSLKKGKKKMRFWLMVTVCLVSCIVLPFATSAGVGIILNDNNLNSTDGQGNKAETKEGDLFRLEEHKKKKNLEQITQRKIQLKAELEALVREKGRLNQELDKHKHFDTSIKLNTMKRQAADIESMIEKLENELKSLSEEEAGLPGSKN